MANALQAAGSHDNKDSNWAPIFTNRFFLGLWTNRNPLRAPTGVIYENYYRLGGTDALIGGSNVEISNRLTVCRRPGNPAGLSTFISSANVPAMPDTFYSFHEIGGTIRVFADTPTAPYLIGGYTNGAGTASQGVIPIFTKGAGVTQSFFQGIGQSLYFSDTAEQQKWLDFGAGNPGNSFSAITNTVLNGNIAVITAINNFVPGQTVVVSGTTNSSGAFNTTAVITAANSNQFTFALTHANIGTAADTGFANACWNWQMTPPVSAPTLNIVASGSAATTWQASTVFSTMGLIVDGNTNVQQLISVNALGGNTTQFGTTGNGNPAWNQTPGGTTADNTITWTNWGPVATWTAHTLYNNNSIGGTLANPCLIYDPTTKHIQVNGAPGNRQGTSGATPPKFTGIIGSFIWDLGAGAGLDVKWFDIGSPALWAGGHVYNAYLNDNPTTTAHAIAEPTLPPSTQTIFWQISGGGTSGASGTAPPFATLAGSQTSDNQLQWLCLGSATWAASTSYTQWTGTYPVFSVVKDSNGNMQICVVSGTSGSTVPLPAWVSAHAYALNDQIVDSNLFVQKVTSNGTSGLSKTLTTSALTSGIATYTTSTNHGYSAGQYVTVTGSTNNAVFNATDALIVAVPTLATFTVNIAHDDIGSAGDVGTSVAGPTWNATPTGTTTDGGVTWTNQGAENAGGRPAGWGTGYGDKTPDGTVTWTCVGPSMAWAATTQWHLPVAGFSPPSASQPYGGSEVIGSAFVQAVISSGKSAASPTPSWSLTIGNFVLDPSTSNTGITWRNIAAQSTNSLSWTKGYGYVFAYKARTTSDLYAPSPTGGGVLLGLSASSPTPLVSQGTTPTGSADASVSSASPSVQMAVAANTGSVVFISGLGSTDPQCDTISIFRTFDGGATFFWVTDIKNPQPVSGNAGTWQYEDFIPDISTNTSAGLNTLVLAPISQSNNPPQAGAINLVQYFGRIFYSVGATVFCSQGPNVGGAVQPPGNGYTAFNPGQFWTFPSPVTRMVPTTVGLLVFTTSDVGIISGGPSITTLFNNIYVPGLGLTSYNALTVAGGLIDLFTADNQVVRFDPNMGVSKIGQPIGDQFFKYGAQTTTFTPSSAYVTFHTQGLNDEALFVADGSTGWFRCVPNMAPDSAISGPVWSPKATLPDGCKAIQSLEVAPGQHALLIGSLSGNQPVMVRDSTYTTFTDRGTPYASNFTFGSMVLANPGQLAELGFITCEFVKTGTSPKLLVLLDEIVDVLVSISAASQSGNSTTYTYTTTSGFTPVIGDDFTITGMADSGNNGTFVVASTGAGTFTVSNSLGVTRAVQTGSGTNFEDLSNYTFSATSLPPQDAPLVYGATLTATTLFTNRYYFAQTIGTLPPPHGTSCRHMQVKIDFSSSDTVQNELLTMSIFGKHWQEV
jgi:hypothetical protein